MCNELKQRVNWFWGGVRREQVADEIGEEKKIVGREKEDSSYTTEGVQTDTVFPRVSWQYLSKI